MQRIARSLFGFAVHTLAPEMFNVVEFDGEEGMSMPYHFAVHLASKDATVAFSEIINAAATLRLGQGPEAVPLHGIITDFEHLGHNASHFFYRAVLRPRVWLLSLTFQSRIFQHRRVPEIIQDVLEAAGLPATQFRFDLQENYGVREYCVQYQETDFHFISRLMEFEGLFYYFEHEPEHEVLVITDHQGGLPAITGEPSLAFHPEEGLASDQPVMRSFGSRERLVTGRVKLNDYNCELPEADLVVESQLDPDMPGMHYEYGLHYTDQAEGGRLARVRNQELVCQRRVMHGQSTSPHVRAGHTFALKGHVFRDELNMDYLITHAVHTGRQQGALEHLINGQAASGVVYHNDLHCIPADVPYRAPRRTPIPRIPGIMTARVEKRDGPFAHLDEQGRYRARMHFDLSDTSKAEATKPLRMNQPYSGPGYGIHFPNHAGTEMIWSCVDGNPDRPLALGTVPNPSQESPVTAINRQQCVIESQGGHRIHFDDAIDAELFAMIAPKDQAVNVGNDRSIHVAHDLSTFVGNDEFRIVDKGNRKVTLVEGNDELVIEKGSLRIDVKSGDVQITSRGGGGALHSKAVSIKGTDSITLTCEGSTIEMTPATILLKSGGSKIELSAGGIVIDGPMVFINS